jgi:hypothetical protein
MSNFFSEQGRTRVYAETYLSYVAGENPRRTPLREKKAIYGWKLAQPNGNTADAALPLIGAGKKDMTPQFFRVRKIRYILQQNQKG